MPYLFLFHHFHRENRLESGHRFGRNPVRMLLNRIHSHQRVLTMSLMPFSQMKYGFNVCLSSSWSHKNTRELRCFTDSSTKISASSIENTASTSLSNTSPLSGIEDEVAGYVFGKRKATEVAQLVWRHVVQKGDTVIDATCGNGYDTLELLKMVDDGSGRGCVYGFDIQQEALQNTSSLLHEVFPEKEKGCVKLFSICHSRIEDIIPENTCVRLVAFNLGYLPGGEKAITTTPETTLLALLGAKRMLMTGGLISVIVYVGHPGGREELEAVEAFASGLSVENWICCKFQMLNRPLAPVPIFIFKR